MTMFYINQTACISPQATFPNADIMTLNESVDNLLRITEPAYHNMPPNVLRRMTKIIRIGVGAAMPLINNGQSPDGIVIGTGNGGMEESSRFLQQIIEYDEGLLTPGDFTQSTPNAIAALIGLINKNHQYNATHVHRGLSFENAAIDAAMLLQENQSHSYLLGGVDATSAYNYRIDYQDGWYKKEPVSNRDLYNSGTPGTISGEGSAMFMVSNNAENALARLTDMAILHHADVDAVGRFLSNFFDRHIDKNIDLLITGEDGDNRHSKYYEACEALTDKATAIARYKHLCGEYPTSSSFALWLACMLLSGQPALPLHMQKRAGLEKGFKNILIYNTHKGDQHSCMLLSKAG